MTRLVKSGANTIENTKFAKMPSTPCGHKEKVWWPHAPVDTIFRFFARMYDILPKTAFGHSGEYNKGAMSGGRTGSPISFAHQAA